MESAQDGGEEKAPPCLGDSSWGLLCLPPHKNPFGTSSCWDPVARQKQMASGRRRSGGMDCIAAALPRQGDRDGDGGGEGRLTMPSTAEVTTLPQLKFHIRFCGLQWAFCLLMPVRGRLGRVYLQMCTPSIKAFEKDTLIFPFLLHLPQKGLLDSLAVVHEVQPPALGSPEEWLLPSA